MTAYTFAIAQQFERPDLCQADLQHFQERIDLYWVDVRQTDCTETLVTLSVDPVREQTHFDPQRFELTPQLTKLEWTDIGREQQADCLERARHWFSQQPE